MMFLCQFELAMVQVEDSNTHKFHFALNAGASDILVKSISFRGKRGVPQLGIDVYEDETDLTPVQGQSRPAIRCVDSPGATPGATVATAVSDELDVPTGSTKHLDLTACLAGTGEPTGEFPEGGLRVAAGSTLVCHTCEESNSTVLVTVVWQEGGPELEGNVIRQRGSVALANDGSAVAQSAGWTSVPGLAITVSTRGGTTLEVSAAVVMNVPALSSGQMRVTLDGNVVGPAQVDYSILGNSSGAVQAEVALPVTAQDTEYALAVQVRCNTVASSVTPRKGSRLSFVEYST